MAMGSKAFESPLISHARMRALFRGVVELRGLARHAKDKSVSGPEACFVAAAIDLKDGDLACDSGGMHEATVLEHVRSIPERTSAGAISRPELKHVLAQFAKAKPDGFPGTAPERLICAVGSAMALRASEENRNVLLAFARRDDLTKADWLRVVHLMGQEGLPMILVALPGQKASVDLEQITRKLAVDGMAVPVIPVDAGDPVGLYRVAQETIVRARAGGGAAVIDAVSFGTDAVKLLGEQLVRKRICTERWVQSVEAHLTKLMAHH